MNLAHHLLPHVAYIHTYVHILHTFLKKVQETAPVCCQLELDVGRGLQCMEEELELLVVALALDFNDVVEVVLSVRLE